MWEDAKVPYICKYCGVSWASIGCEQHVLFECSKVSDCIMKSFHKYGPGTPSNICVGKYQWASILHKTSANPYSLQHGIEVQVRLAYFAEVIALYTEEEEGIDWNQNTSMDDKRDLQSIPSLARCNRRMLASG